MTINTLIPKSGCARAEGKRKTSHLCGQGDDGDGNHEDHEDLTGPDVGVYVSVPHCGEGDDDQPERLEDADGPVAASLQVFHSAGTANRPGVEVSKTRLKQTGG